MSHKVCPVNVPKIYLNMISSYTNKSSIVFIVSLFLLLFHGANYKIHFSFVFFPCQYLYVRKICKEFPKHGSTYRVYLMIGDAFFFLF